MTAPDGIWLARPEPPRPGVPVAVKDLLDTAGLVTTYGSALFAEHVPAQSAEAVLRLEAAGYAVAGKTNLHEFAYGISSQNPHFGTVPNPRARGRLAGGSSGGSAAAIAAGDVDLALGTDSGGSIRIPAAWCGIAGFKPTFDLVPTDGCFPLAPSYDHVGPMAATVEGCVELMCALVPGFAPAALESLEEVRIGVVEPGDADRETVEVVEPLGPERRSEHAHELDAAAHGRGYRPDVVVARRERETAAGRDEVVRRLEAGDPAPGGRDPDRAAGVGAERELDVAGCDRRG